MTKKAKKGIQESAVKAALRTPLFRMRKVPDGKVYSRKGRRQPLE